VKRAQALYLALKSSLGGECTSLIHARMPLGERLKREQQVLEKFGRERGESRPAKHVVVGTQVLEQSLDVDFDLMFSEMAPVDLIFQRIGRLHRHNLSMRPEHLRVPLLLLEQPETIDKKPEFRWTDSCVYSRALLLRSWFALRRLRRIAPDDVERLIHQVYDGLPEKVTVQEREIISAADAEEQERDLKEKGEALARMIAVPTSETFPDLSPTPSILEEDAPEIHQALQALTRLGPPAISLVCLHRSGDSTFLDAEAKVLIDLESSPTTEVRRLLTSGSVSVSHHAIYAYFSAQTPPQSWRKDPILRHMRAVELVNGSFSAKGFTLTLDGELGLLIETGSNKED
jgi:CRISPR-associated endonuclease/helicase Cas3